MLQRIRNWPRALATLIEQRRDQPFAWGPNDCAAFAADDCLAITGADHLVELRGPRSSERQARQMIRAGGGIAAALERAGLVRVPVTLAQRGDLVEVLQGKRRVLAVCVGHQVVAPGPRGLETALLRDAEAAWRI